MLETEKQITSNVNMKKLANTLLAFHTNSSAPLVVGPGQAR